MNPNEHFEQVHGYGDAQTNGYGQGFYDVAHVVARLAGEEYVTSPRQILVAWLEKHYPDAPGLVTAANEGWENAREGKPSRTFIFERYSRACARIEALVALTPHLAIPPGGFHSYLYDWVARADSVTGGDPAEPNSDYRRTARDGDARPRSAPLAAIRAEDQPALSGWVGARGHLPPARTLLP